MLNNLKFPLIYAIEVLLWLLLLTGFYGAISFLAAKPVTAFDLQGKSLPADWEAAIPNHGEFVEGYLISNHLTAFVSIIALLIICAFLLSKVHKAQLDQQQTAGPIGARAHTIAKGCVFVALAILGYIFLTHVLVSVSAA